MSYLYIKISKSSPESKISTLNKLAQTQPFSRI